jgi:hypothetical protein
LIATDYDETPSLIYPSTLTSRAFSLDDGCGRFCLL